MRWFLRLMTVLAFAAAFSTQIACNTAEGVGEDIEEGGEAIGDAAD